ncbi:SgcJ/EcaC family oxidoreductase [Nesterenkonia sp. E16_7]|uniref:SgcJ/EcaC family oxidoreductase n=1 Tax=unclassified Nesterenkonia TaxID=2629769 RepID=UPI001A91E846|nr:MULTISPECIES: SgcJ/EcaC family oxidoreductase [unclassified Nesterenkonia]MBO0595796.1 SgcJ/EcaC family oxidoreductase [Nesterenkonia sp. E16_10]MBO0599605.1 SgcJ/EcaC family oxidoreductase [Nesterenkonia sp. E16_7]
MDRKHLGVETPGDIAEGFAEAWNRADAEALAALFVEDADFVNVVGLWWTNRTRIRTAHAYGFAKIFGGSQMQLEQIRVRELGESVAVVHAVWTLTGQTPAPGEAQDTRPGARQGVISFTLQRQPGTPEDQEDGSWLAVSAQNTDRVPGAETLTASGESRQPTAYQDLSGTPRR